MQQTRNKSEVKGGKCDGVKSGVVRRSHLVSTTALRTEGDSAATC